jgi:integrase
MKMRKIALEPATVQAIDGARAAYGLDGGSILGWKSSEAAQKQIRRVLDRAIEKWGLDPKYSQLQTHDFRHSRVTAMWLCGISMLSISKWMGHSSVAIT